MKVRPTILMAGLLAGALFAGCSNDSPWPVSPASGKLIAVSPADGTTNVRVDAGLLLTFSGPVDRVTVQRGLHLISAAALSDSACPDSATLSHPDMEHCMLDPAMMRHLDEYHGTSGSFSWNAAGTVCTFQPATWMSSATNYMVHMGGDVAGMMGEGMGGMGGDHDSGKVNADVTLHFTTMDTSGGHDGHH